MKGLKAQDSRNLTDCLKHSLIHHVIIGDSAVDPINYREQSVLM